jgi:arginase
MRSVVAINAATELGLRRERADQPSGVVGLPAAMREAGLLEMLQVGTSITIPVGSYSAEPDPELGVLNPQAIREFSFELADAVERVVRAGEFPLVLGGDCSVLLGSMMGLRRIGKYGVLFLDGHSDFYTPESSSTGGVAGMDLAIACGLGPEALTRMEGDGPLIQPAHVVHLGRRDLEESLQFGGSLEKTGIDDWHLERLRREGIEQAMMEVLARFQTADFRGIWIHIDADVLDDSVMPAVDSRQPGGMTYSELVAVLRAALASGKVSGMELTIFDPSRDPSGKIAAALAAALSQAFSG